MSKRFGANFCGVCGKPLHNVPCHECNGTGEVRAGYLGRKLAKLVMAVVNYIFVQTC